MAMTTSHQRSDLKTQKPGEVLIYYYVLLPYIIYVMQSGRFSQCPAFLGETAKERDKKYNPSTFCPALLKSEKNIVNNHSCCFSHQTDPGDETEGLEREGLEMER